MIPITIQRSHILKAAEWIDEHGDGGRPSKRYSVIINGRPYPPKLVISKAHFFAHGSDWPSDNFKGGKEANTCLNRLGFEIKEIRAQSTEIRSGRRSSSKEVRAAAPHTSTLDRVRLIAKSLDTPVTRVESDVEDCDGGSLLILHMGEDNTRDIHIFSGRQDEDDLLYVVMPIPFNPPISGYVGDMPEEEYSEFMAALMHGRTGFKLGLDGKALKNVDLHQTFPVPGGEDALKRAFIAAVVEILATEENVRKAVHEARAAMSSSKGKRTGSALGDSMYA